MSPASLAALVPTQWKAGDPSPNPTGKPKTKPITDAMRLLLDGNLEAFRRLPRPLQLVVGRWYGATLHDPRALSLLLDRIEGRVTDELPPPLPEIVVEVQRLVGVYRGPVAPQRQAPIDVESKTVKRDG